MTVSRGQSRSLRLLAAVFAGLALAIAAVGYSYYRMSMASQRQTTEDALNSIAGLKAHELSSWIGAHATRTLVTRRNPLLIDPLRRLLAGTATAAERDDLAVWLGDLGRYSYAGALLLDAHGRVVLSSGPPRAQFDTTVLQQLAGLPADSFPAFIDLHRDCCDSGVYFDIPFPVTRADDSSTVAGSVILRLDPQRNLFPLIRTWPVPSRSAETLLVRRAGAEVLFLNELRHSPAPPLTLRAPLADPDLPAAMALRGERGIVHGRDYRGAPVVAALRAVPGTPWCIVAKIDEDEAYAPLRRSGVVMLVLVCTAVLLFGLSAGFLWYRAEQQAVQLSEAKYRGAFYHCPIGLMLLDRRGVVLACNRYVAQVFGTRAEAYIGLELPALLPPGPLRQTLLDALADDRIHRYEGPHTSVLSGRTVWISVSSEQATPGTVTAIIEDITSRREAEEELRRANAALQQANAELRTLDDLKSNLIANVSHELRTPLVAIRGYTELLLESEPRTLTPEQCDSLRVMLRNIDRLTVLFDNLLEFSRPGPSRRGAAPAPCLLEPLLQDVCATLRLRVLQRGVTLVCPAVEAGLDVPADQQQLRQVMLNLVDNAVKFTPSGGSVTVTAHGDDAAVRISVADTGIGIGEAEQARIFDRFYQVDSSATRAYSGVGLGLAIVREIVVRHGGTIGVQSRSGAGTEFTITLPRSRARETNAGRTGESAVPPSR